LQITVRIKEEGQHLQFPIRIYSNDPVSPETVCTVRAEAAPALLRTEPTEVNFGEIALGTAPVKCLKVFKLNGMAWPAKESISAEWSDGLALQMDSETQRENTRKGGLVFSIRPRAGLLPGNFSDTLTICPPGSRRGVRIPVMGVIVPRFVLSPSGLYFEEVQRNSGILKRYVMLRRTDGKAVHRIARSEGPPVQDPVFPEWTYTNGGVNPWGKTDYAGNVNIILGNLARNNDPKGPLLKSKTERIADIADGLSNTILVGEKAIDTRAYNTGGWYWDEPIFAGGGAGDTVRGGSLVVQDGSDIDFRNNWGSAHPGGAQFLFGDGSIRQLAYGLDEKVMKALLSPAGGEVVPDF
jgi:prepilin-type processing-associated H-X9-DG protein